MPTIAISYRREDTRWIVGRIFDHLVGYYGRESIFMDIDGVPLGLDFRDQIRNTLQRSDIVLAVIGPQWLAVQKETGQPRIVDETDWVRIEIEAALGKKIPVIPVLIDRTPLPKPNELPEALREFAYRQATNIDTGVDFQTQMDRLIRSIDELLERQGNTTKGSAEKKSGHVVGLLGNANLGSAQRTATGGISNIRSRSGLDWIGGASGWVTRQAITWFQMVKSPRDFVSSIDLASADEFGKSVQFLFFIIMCVALLHIPLDALDAHQRVYDPTTQIASFILSAIEAFVFGSVIWLFGRAVGGKGQYRSTLVAGFYSIAFFPFLTVGMYAGFSNPKAPSGTFWGPPNPDPVISWVSLVVALIILVYVGAKLISLIRYVHSVGVIRASIVFVLTVTVSICYEGFIAKPFTDQLAQAAAIK
jgi:TIR domain